MRGDRVSVIAMSNRRDVRPIWCQIGHGEVSDLREKANKPFLFGVKGGGLPKRFPQYF
jgi:hypothetical protein